MTGDLAVFALETGRDFGERVAAALGVSLSAHEEKGFEDGEHKTRPLVSVRGKDVYVIESLYGDERASANDRLCRLLFFIGALRDASAERITAVIPYLCYARKDRKSKARDPVTTRYVAALFEAVGVDRVVTLDVHNLAAFQNAFRIRTDHLEARRLFIDHFAPLVGATEELVIVSPDAGGIKRAEDFRQALGSSLGRAIRSAFMEKYRSDGALSGETLAGEVKGRIAIVIDDLISSGATILRAAEACREQGAKQVFAAATHGVFSAKAEENLSSPALDHVVITDTIPPWRLDPGFIQSRLRVLDSSGLFAGAVRGIHAGESLLDLLEA